MKEIVVVGAGIGGLVTAATLSRLGYPVTVLEAHVYAGGCAGTFYHQGFRFDAGATLAAGFYPGGPMDLVAQAAGIETWEGHSTDLAMLVHMPDGERIPRWGDSRRQHAYQDAFTKQAMPFWDWQENTADALWDLFPGQSIAATALGSLNAAKQIHWESEREYLPSHPREFPPAQHTLSA